MGAGNFLTRLAQSWLEQEKERNGVAAMERSTAAEADNSLLKRAQAAQMLQKLQSQPALDQSEVDLRHAQGDLYRDHGISYRTPKPPSVGNANPVVDEGGTVVGYVGTKPGPDGNLPHYDTAGRPIGSVHPSVMEGAVPAAQFKTGAQGDAPTTAPSSPTPIPPAVAGPASAAAAALASVGGGNVPSMPTTFRTKAKPAPKAPPRPTYIAGTLPDGSSGFVDSHTLQPAPAGASKPPLPITERTRVDQAGHVIEQGEALLREYDKNPDLFGASGVMNDFKTNHSMATLALGQPDARWSHLKAAETSLSAFQPIMHGSRGGEGLLQHFQQNIAPNPAIGVEQRKAAVSALIEAAKRIQQYGPEADLSDLQGAVGPQSGGSASDVEAIKRKHGITY